MNFMIINEETEIQEILTVENKKAPACILPEEVMLDIRNLAKVYPVPRGEYVVLENLKLQVMKEEFISIIGHSGCGKSTLLTMIAGLNSISGGQILLDGKP